MVHEFKLQFDNPALECLLEWTTRNSTEEIDGNLIAACMENATRGMNFTDWSFQYRDRDYYVTSAAQYFMIGCLSLSVACTMFCLSRYANAFVKRFVPAAAIAQEIAREDEADGVQPDTVIEMDTVEKKTSARQVL